MTPSYQHVFLVTAMGVAAFAAILEWTRKGDVPSWATVPVIVLAPLLHVAIAAAAREPLESAVQEGAVAIGGGLICAIVPMLLFRQSALAAADVKLFVALGALLQPLAGIEAQLYAFFAAGVLAPARLAYEGKLGVTLKNAVVIGTNSFLPASRRRRLDASVLSSFRLGPAVAVAVALVSWIHW